MTSIGDRLKQLRLKNKLTQEEVGQKIGVSKQTLYKYENGIITNIPSDKIEKLSQVYGVTPACLMGWEEKSPSTLPPLTRKDERDIARDLEKMLACLENDEALAFYDGEPMDEESKELLRISLENSMRLATQLAKKKYTPKKYRK